MTSYTAFEETEPPETEVKDAEGRRKPLQGKTGLGRVQPPLNVKSELHLLKVLRLRTVNEEFRVQGNLTRSKPLKLRQRLLTNLSK